MSIVNVSFADASGVFTGQGYSGPASLVEANTPPGCLAIPGEHDHRRVRWDAAAGEVVPHQPPPPADPSCDWAWDAAAWRWVGTPTLATRAAAARAERDRRLNETDTQALRAIDGPPLSAAWRAYRQALRDVPAQAGFPDSIDWPEMSDA